jgi:thiamine biosynthesis lipoprotein
VTAPTRIVRVEHLMGTVVGVDVRDAVSADEVTPALDRFFESLRDVDRRFSPWRPDSEISRIADGDVAEADASPDVRWVLAACDHLAATTGGAFDARRHHPDGRLDPSGFVKGWSVEEASWHLTDAGLRSFAINAGGDVTVHGTPNPGNRDGHGWRVGIRNPDRIDAIAAVLEVRDLAVATSGLYECGDHIRDPRTSNAPDTYHSFTVVGPSLAWADAYATAGLVMGRDALGWVASQPGYGAVAISPEGELLWTGVAEPLLVLPVRGSEARRKTPVESPKFSRSSQAPSLSWTP